MDTCYHIQIATSPSISLLLDTGAPGSSGANFLYLLCSWEHVSQPLQPWHKPSSLRCSYISCCNLELQAAKKKTSESGKVAKKTAQGAERGLYTPKKTNLPLFFQPQRIFQLFYILLSCENEAQHQDGYGSRPRVTNDEGPVGKPFSPPFSGHQEWKQLRSSEPSAAHPPRPHPSSLAHTSSCPLDTPPSGRTPAFCSMPALLPNFSFS
ncbi:unnamed protein product [Rangifer tarandus platyrhynchus]|uniref:Uncharacterized protein n=2 Tax=Rangifer tarandus platyrhynchus TaxID=3082113 RepID=A0AC59Y942_RANTA|nr:unnamed protein product [Rangifer tarandus platyrhynchus]